ncbi:M1 family aminopeptidase [Glaciecola sp. 2405UD65-10]|uniref:ABC transporter permease/M1 family aminopeptidase n=1 Tax=Glaciecola sp. 2405UD65-10 TaxID=3397244 RepID=UPI003B58C009
MLRHMLSFEWRYFIRQPSYYVTTSLFFVLSFLSVAVENVQIGSSSNINFNSPYAIAETSLILNFFAIFLVVNFVANSAVRNDNTLMSELLYTKPIKSFEYQFGRFLGAYLVILSVLALVPLGLFLGSVMPWLDQERIGEFNLLYYISPFFIFTVPTSLALSALLYAVALRFKTIMPVYLLALSLVILFSISGLIFDDPNHDNIRSILDIFGLSAFMDTTQYWTPSQKNSNIIGLSEMVFANRVFWLVAATCILLFFSRLFRPLSLTVINDKQILADDTNDSPINNEIDYSYQQGAWFKQFLARTSFEVKQVVFSPAFLVLLLIGGFLLVMNFIDATGLYGTSHYPITQYMVELINNGFSLSLLVVITFYTGEVVWRERGAGIGDIIDSMPVHSLIFWASKLLAIIVVILTLFAVGMLCGIVNQLLHGYTNIDLPQYVTSLLYFRASFWVLLCILAFFIQALSPNKYMGMLIFVAYYFVTRNILVQIGFEHNMFNYGATPDMVYSDMNSYGWSLLTQHYYMMYWGALALVLAVFSYAMWQRGPDTNLANRLKIIGYSLGPKGQFAVVIGTVLFISVGTLIHYNTRVINSFETRDEQLQLQVDYEQSFKAFEDDPIPTITAVNLEAAIFPKLRKLEAISTISVYNNTSSVIIKVLVNYPRNSSVAIDGANISDYNPRLKTAWLTFKTPLKPQERSEISVRLSRQHFGFKDKDEDASLVKNGTFINNVDLFPYFGVNRNFYVNDPHQRRKYNLPVLQRAYLLEDESKYSQSNLGANVGYIDFKAKLSTSEEQIALAPGKLLNYWSERSRNYFVYESDAPILNLFNIMSAKLKVKSAVHNGIDISVYYHHQHKWNVDRMLASSMDAVDFFSATFGPYQHKQLRIIEFPGYRSFAQSFASTIPYSERMGFISDLRNTEKIDPVYYITAHEVAHQWFGHQLTPANVQGSQVITETLSQYAALQLMQQQFGEDKVRQLLRYELDAYLKGRAKERFKEMPLIRSENQDYIHYRKGAIIMMAIGNRIGFNALNEAINALLEKYRFSQGRLATTLDLLNAIKEASPVEHHSFIDEQFTQINLFNIAVLDHNIQNQQLIVNIHVEKLAVSGKGEESQRAFDDWVEIVIFDEDPNDFAKNQRILYREKHKLINGSNTVNIDIGAIEAEISYLGVDPFIHYIDRDISNNIINLRK